jgi:hypothetical protein
MIKLRVIIVRLTGIDELELRYLPSFFLGDFFLYLSDLGKIPVSPALAEHSRRDKSSPSPRALHQLRISAV